MWAHYAEKHRGFCVGINKKTLSFIKFTKLIDVEYLNSLPKRPLFPSDEENVGYLLKHLSTKSKHWSYEREVRLVYLLKSRIAINLPSDFINEIIFGISMSEEHKNEITDLRNKNFPTAKLFQAELDRNRFKINLKLLSK
jgi:hypothetical protein